jgi:ribosomal protein S27AE
MAAGDSAGGAHTAHGPLSSDELVALWDTYRAGKPAICPREGGAVAVAVDATAHAYRLVCVRCGAATPWFESPPTGVRVRTGTSSMPAAKPVPE